MHNEALQRLDLMVAAAVEELPRASPPEAPAVGACYIVAAGATGDWQDRDDCLAGYSSGGWRYVEPFSGMAAYVRSSQQWGLFTDGAWEIGVLRGSSVRIDGLQVVGSRAGAIAVPSGGITVDVEARGAIEQIVSTLRQHGLIET